MNFVDNRQTIVKDSYDVVVVGGGIAGVAAAVSAAREGAKTLLMEKSIIFGGLATAGLISWYEPLCDGRGTKMIGSIAEELIRLAIKFGFDNLPEEWKDGKNSGDAGRRYATHFSPTIFAMALDEYLAENNVHIVLDCLATFPVMNNARCEGVAAETKEGRVLYGAKTVVDATGDADVFAKAMAPVVTGQNYMTFIAHGIHEAAIEAYTKKKDMAKLRKWFFAGSDLFGGGHPEGMKLFEGVDSEEITKFVLTGRKMLFDSIKADDKNSRDITMLPFMPQFRTIRHIAGEHDFKAVDGEKFENSIGSCGDFRPNGRGKRYQIPFTALYNKSFDNLIAAGRCISASGDGWEVTRVIPVCALTGEAAGVAAALSLNERSINAVDVKKLQKILKNNGVLFL